MHDHRFVFTSEHDAICEDITCKFRYSKAEILRLLFEVANDEAAEQSVHPTVLTYSNTCWSCGGEDGKHNIVCFADPHSG